jgi:hypothetical protein
MALHLMPAGEEHEPDLTCPCRPQLGLVVREGRRRAAVRHRRMHEVLASAVVPRADEIETRGAS